MTKYISIKGAREHNLKNIDLDIPKNTLTVITGLSGSGKSSLAFDTIYAEGQRRYVESLSAYARQFLDLANKPDVDRIDGLSPAISIEQKTTSRNPRSTVGTITEIYDYMRLLYAQIGEPHCPKHDIPIKGQTISQMVDAVMDWSKNTPIQIIAPVVQGRKGEYRKDIQNWQKQGFNRIRIDGKTFDISDTPKLDKKKKHTLEVVVDRLKIKPENRTRIGDSIEAATKLASGMVQVEEVFRGDTKPKTKPKTVLFSEKHACSICNHAIPAIEPRLFSFNSPYGACKTCDGLGEVVYFSEERIVPDGTLSIAGGAIKTWKENWLKEYYGSSLAKYYGFDINTPFEELSEKVRNVIFYGSGKEEIYFCIESEKTGGQFSTTKAFEGLIPALQRKWLTAPPMKREGLDSYRSSHPCDECHGKRLNKDALAVKIKGKNIVDISQLPVADALTYFNKLKTKLSGNALTIATPILKEVISRLTFLDHVGLNYLGLSRRSGTLSGGESQRIRLASQIGSGLTGVLYVLDEPSIGLHQRDNHKLLETLNHLKNLDNTVIVVEHDEDAIRSADHIIDMGIGAGVNGGEVVATGKIADILACKESLTGQYLSGKREIAVPKKRRKTTKNNAIKIFGASENNLKNVNVSFPLGVMTCVTGVSGSGKSTLVMATLHKALAKAINKGKETPGAHEKITGLEKIDKIVNIDQSAIGRTPRSNPATYTGIMTPIREWFAGLPEAKTRGYNAGRFSFNVKGGRCEACSGDGMIKVEMHFLADVYVPCEACHSKRYNRETLEVTYRGKSIADVLAMTVAEALEFFKAVPKLKTKLQTLQDVGLSYIHLGQSATTLSGGEAQRIKLSKELSKRASGKTMYILDEPTTGLHFADIDMLLKVLHRLVGEGNSMVIIEHNLDVIKTADWVIDIGPEGGAGGGEIIAEGTPEAVAKVSKSYTGQYLTSILNKNKTSKK